MKFYRCKCGSRRAWGSMPPPPCAKCRDCASGLAQGPNEHLEPLDHEFRVDQVKTDRGLQPVTRCRWCLVTKADIDAGID